MREGTKVVPADKNLFSLYQSCGELLARDGRIDEAVTLLKQGIASIPADKSLFSLYQSCGELLARDGRIDEAVTLLKQGIASIPADKNLFSLYQSCGELLARDGRIDEAVTLLKQGIASIPADKNLYSLYQSCGELLARDGRIEEAVTLLKQGIASIPADKNLFSLYQSCGELLARDGRIEEAVTLLKQGIASIPADKSLSSLYQSCGELLARDGRIEEAVTLLKQGIASIPADKNLFSLYQSCGAIYAHAGTYDSALDVLQRGIASLPPGKGSNRYFVSEAAVILAAAMGSPARLQGLLNATGGNALEPPQKAIGVVLQYQMRQDWEGAATIAASERAQLPIVYFPLFVQEAFSWLGAGQPARAREALASFPGPIKREPGSSTTWLETFIALRCGDHGAAREAYSYYLGRPLAAGEGPTEAELLRLWDKTATNLQANKPAYHFPTLPPTLTGLAAPVTRTQHGPPMLPQLQNQPTVTGGAPARSAVLAVASEWASGHGGLSTFNRELCLAWAKARPEHRLLCLIPSKASPEQVEEARARGVELVVASSAHGLPEEARLSVRPSLPDGISAQILLGHGRVTGRAASALQEQFPGSRRVHFIHVASDEIEYFKDQPPGYHASQKAEERTLDDVERAASADLAVAVGPRLARLLGNELHARDKKVHPIVPGLPEIEQTAGPPPGLQCLLLGRAEDYALKGLDIAARAVAKLDPSRLASRPWLLVRGAPSGTGDALREKLRRSAGTPGLDVRVREYTAVAARIANDLRASSVVLMPSRAEGFGLVGLEAIAAGVPVLLSDQSGLGELIVERCPKLAQHHVVGVSGDLEADANAWERELDRVLRDTSAAFARAIELRNALRESLSWEKAIGSLLANLAL
ncbi:glycosyltransferase [Sorangium sp. So ce1151]|uniref:glycosyltransferase n=1 Tax=Sorangium sp. So ce1151 TaxID=3133332 RepID=UPI003F648F7E